MKLQDILLTGMDIPKEVSLLLHTVEASTINGMTANEYKAYQMGVENTLSAIKAILGQDDHIVFHLEGHGCMEEFDLDELIEIVEEKEGC
jgi:DNA relaxase NicK